MGAGDGFKIVPLGFDKNDVNSYISELNKKMAKMEADMAVNNSAAAEAHKLAEDADIRIKAAVGEKDAKIAELNEKLLNERRGIDTYKVQIEDLQQKLLDKEKEIHQSASGLSADHNKSKAYNDVINKANADAATIIANAKAQAEKILMVAEGDKIRTQESIVELLNTLSSEVNKINSSCGSIFSAASFLKGVKAPEISAPSYTAPQQADFDNSFASAVSPAGNYETAVPASDEFSPFASAVNAAEAQVPAADDGEMFSWDGSVDQRAGLGIDPDVDENDIIGSIAFNEPENNGFGVIENNSSSGMDSLNPADFAGVDMSDSINDAWTGFAEEKPAVIPGFSSDESNELGIEWTGMQPAETTAAQQTEPDEMSSLTDDLFSMSGDDEMTTEIAESAGPDGSATANDDMLSGFGDFLGMTQQQPEAVAKNDDNVSIEPLVSYLDQDNSSLYDEKFDNELVSLTMPVNDISGLSGAVDDDLLEAAKAAESAITGASAPAVDDSPWLQLQKELEEMEKLGAFSDSNAADSTQKSETAAAVDPFSSADTTSNLMWDISGDKSSDDDDEMSTTTSGFTF